MYDRIQTEHERRHEIAIQACYAASQALFNNENRDPAWKVPAPDEAARVVVKAYMDAAAVVKAIN